MKLKSLLEECKYEIVKGEENINIQYITGMADEVRENSLYILTDRDDAKAKVEKALKKGAIAVLSDFDVEADACTLIKTADVRKSMAKISIKYFNRPSFNFRLTGITGSTGKTATINLVQKVMMSLKRKTAIIGTDENIVDGKVLGDKNIDQNSIKLQHLFHEIASANVSDVLMEVSSRTIVGDRIHGVRFDIAVFTNIKNERTDFYENFENYLKSKREIFEQSSSAVVNMDDENWKYMVEGLDFKKLVRYSSVNENAEIFAKNVSQDGDRLSLDLVYDEKVYKLSLIDCKCNMQNILAAVAVCILSNISIDAIVAGLND